MEIGREKEIVSIIKKYTKNHAELISILEEIQNMYGYLPGQALKIISEHTEHSLVDIYGVATFYKAFSLKPRGKHLVLVCLGTACHVRGAPKIVEEFEQQLGVVSGDTTADKEFTLETVNCLGACALGPTVVVDGHYFSHVSRKKVKTIITKTLQGLDTIDIGSDRRIFPVKVSCSVCKKSLMDSDYLIDGYPSIKININYNGKQCWLRLSSLYGSYNIASEFKIPSNEQSKFYCPHCADEISGSSHCPQCGSSMAALLIRDGCTLEICTRRGCRGHMLNLNPINALNMK
ncbi:MAG: NAD(P)H-dependent oxidoreductase subunit E [Spirochaetales bacterium]|nr:NAD(P)H-dependent oxidoreductase subunit E [Spirochaetales bacterium]